MSMWVEGNQVVEPLLQPVRILVSKKLDQKWYHLDLIRSLERAGRQVSQGSNLAY